MNFDKYEWVIGPEGYNGSTHSYLVDGTDPYTGENAEQYRAKGYKVVSNDELTELIRQYEDGLTSKWEEITEQAYEDALNVLPPLKWDGNSFFCAEAFTGSLHAFYCKSGGRFYTSLQRIYAKREEIMASLFSARL